MVNINISQDTMTQKEVAGMTYEQWQAYLKCIQECTCDNPHTSALACPACQEANRIRYGDEIPFKFGGQR